jgi:hypothetical protein
MSLAIPVGWIAFKIEETKGLENVLFVFVFGEKGRCHTGGDRLGEKPLRDKRRKSPFFITTDKANFLRELALFLVARQNFNHL